MVLGVNTESKMANNRTPQPPTLEKPDRTNDSHPGGFADEEGNTSRQPDPDFVQPNTQHKDVVPAANNQDPQQMLAGLFDSPTFQKLVEQAVQSRIASTPQASEASVTGGNTKPSVKPDFNFLKHYRNDASPELAIQELDMSAEVPQLAAIAGRKMRFRRGHFYATTQNQVDQIEWMINTPTHSADGTRVTGGVLGIYEDDGEVLYYCTAGCGVDQFIPTASQAKFKAHMRAVHQVEV